MKTKIRLDFGKKILAFLTIFMYLYQSTNYTKRKYFFTLENSDIEESKELA